MNLEATKLARHVSSGCDLRVTRNRDRSRRVVITRQMGLPNREYNLPENLYQTVMNDFVLWLADQHQKGVQIEIKMDFHGSQWVEMRGGFLGIRKSKIGLSQRYINQLAQEFKEPILDVEVAKTAA